MENTPPAAKKTAKDKQNKDKFLRIRITTEAFNRVSARAKEAGYTLGAYCRIKIDEEDDGLRARRRPIAEIENVTKVLGNLGSIRALHNQMAHQANIHGFDPMTFNEAQDAAREYRDFLYKEMGRKAPPSRGGRTEPRAKRKDVPPKAPPGALPPGSKFTGGNPNA